MPIARTAYVDESSRVRAGLYVLAAVIVADAQAEWHQEALLALLHRGQRRLHWRNENSKRRAQLVSAVRHLPHTGAVVIATGVTPRRQERARRKCIERLLAELADRRIAAVVFERRHEELDARDRTMVAALRRQRTVPAWLRVSWVAATDEPLLWLPDIAAGAASLAAAGDATYWEELAVTFRVDRFPLT
jgi:ribosomal protein S12